MLRRFLKHHEFWHPRVFEAPFYAYLLLQCLRHRVSLRGLAKANYALDHGEIGLGSKYVTQCVFDESRFPATCYLDISASEEGRVLMAQEFASKQGLPLILKPDIGMVGKGLIKVTCKEELAICVAALRTNTLLQAFCDYPLEFGVFYVRTGGEARITGINQKHYPYVTGDGRRTVHELALAHSRFSYHWSSFLKYLDLQRVPAEGERVMLSFIGSHTLGCLFTDDTALQTDALCQSVFDLFEDVPGFNYGRLDVKAKSVEDLQRGDFVVIEVNGISSLPTHMFDPKYRLYESYQHFFAHADYLVEAASEHKDAEMELMPLLDIARHVRYSKKELEILHRQQLKNIPS